MTLTQVVLAADYAVAGDTAAGQLRIGLTGDLRDAADGTVIPAETLVVYLEQGTVAVQVYATDDPTTLPAGRRYLVQEEVVGATPREYLLDVPHEPDGSRTVTDAQTTAGSPVLASASAAWGDNDIGTYVTGPGIPPLTTVASVQNSVLVTLSAPVAVTAIGVRVLIGARVGLA